ncbi:MAG: hypothetical protein KJ609_18515 [Gammaproteobacteria bacterium]|nr:hypothetical protein [Gammaproteobacteria bacterium]MBU2024306.1 hypothetical protein [Gammaproteobacteria bacterium]MBU2239971.1 hypothetical protein [Gammaproteobacteria bacterium]MBU2320548.1 hypothetical protein [Gammaproteobacteria bacterium]MBU2412753.1 hypothetical protein [Gammaproteobacteria bacterium]
MKRYMLSLFILSGFYCSGILATDLSDVADKVISSDQRNTGVEIQLSSDANVLQFCIEDVGELSSQVDVFRVFLQTAAALKEQHFHDVALCYEDTVQYLLSGDDFNVIGNEFGVRNVAYTVRMFPEKLRLKDGSQAFEAHRGGILYVMNKQMSDFHDMNRQWYLSDILQKRKAIEDSKRPTTFAKDEDVF